MWLLLTAAAAIAATVGWWITAPTDKHHLAFLALIYWGATLMWLVDHVIAFAEDGGPFFDLSLQAALVGLSVLVLGLLLWLARLLLARRTKTTPITSDKN